jgi:HD-GYP domain-containing protein (c-di-GMP phosphodiesterase class II)
MSINYSTLAGIYSHSNTVITLIFGKLLCLERVEDVALVALVHDIGEFFVESDSLLYRRTKWNDLDLIKHLKHPVESVRILERKNLILDKDQREIVLSHHEMVGWLRSTEGA